MGLIDLDGANNAEAIAIFNEEMAGETKKSTGKLGLDPDNVEQGLAKLVLTVIDLLKKLMENQALRRIENGTVTDEETERMGNTFMKLDEKMAELREIFHLKESDLNIDLGPLGKLM